MVMMSIKASTQIVKFNGLKVSDSDPRTGPIWLHNIFENLLYPILSLVKLLRKSKCIIMMSMKPST